MPLERKKRRPTGRFNSPPCRCHFRSAVVSKSQCRRCKRLAIDNDFARHPKKPFQQLTNNISPLNATVQDIYDAGGKQNNPPIIIVQDIHMNAEAQTNISATLQALLFNDTSDWALSALRARSSVLILRRSEHFPDSKIRDRVAKAFLDDARLAAAVVCRHQLTAIEPPAFIGITTTNRVTGPTCKPIWIRVR